MNAHDVDARDGADAAPNLGWFELCLNVSDVARSVRFYGKLGFRLAGGCVEEGWGVMERDGVRLALYQEMIAETMLNFRGGDVAAIADALAAMGLTMESGVHREEDESMGATIRDPDGNLIYFNTAPGESAAGW